MSEEINALEENNTYEFTAVPIDKKVMGGRQVYTIKLGPNNEEQFKVRYCDVEFYSELKRSTSQSLSSVEGCYVECVSQSCT